MAARTMSNINAAKRAAHRRRVQETLQAILNDPSAMPNADCADLVVSVSRVEFGRTVGEIFCEAHTWPRHAQVPGTEPAHERYMREARLRGEQTYADLDDVLYFPQLMAEIERELQRRLGLLYTPRIRRLAEIGESGE